MKNSVSVFKKMIFLVLISACSCNTIQKKLSKISIIDYGSLENQKSKIKKGDKKAFENYNLLLNQADTILKIPFFSVTNKIGIPPSKNKHDYMSIGPYWWSNPNTEDGLPYIRKDGEINPETRNNFTDYIEKSNFISAIKILTKTYYYSNEQKYGEKGIQLIKAWFLEDETKMNPNVNFGQYVPGRSEGRCFGILETLGFVEVLKFLELAKDRTILDKNTEEAMVKWFTEFSSWLQNSELGKEEATRENNHAVHYDTQLLNILLYLNRVDFVKEYLSTITKARVFQQIEPDGSQPRELARTKSYSYTVMNLSGFLELAELGKKVGINLWDMESKDGRSIKKAYQYMLPYLREEKVWKYQQIADISHAEKKLIANLKHIRNTFKDDAFDMTIELLNKKNNIKN